VKHGGRDVREPTLGPTRVDAPWIESPSGELFFLNAVLVSPAAVALLPLGLRSLLRALGASASGPYLETVPAVAAYVAPWVGWLALLPLATTVKNLRMERRPAPRVALGAFLVVHLGVLAYTFGRWLGAGAGP